MEDLYETEEAVQKVDGEVVKAIAVRYQVTELSCYSLLKLFTGLVMAALTD